MPRCKVPVVRSGLRMNELCLLQIIRFYPTFPFISIVFVQFNLLILLSFLNDNNLFPTENFTLLDPIVFSSYDSVGIFIRIPPFALLT